MEPWQIAFEKWLDRDNPYGPYETTCSSLACEDMLNEWDINNAISSLRHTFKAGWDAAQEPANT